MWGPGGCRWEALCISIRKSAVMLLLNKAHRTRETDEVYTTRAGSMIRGEARVDGSHGWKPESVGYHETSLLLADIRRRRGNVVWRCWQRKALGLASRVAMPGPNA